MISKDSFPLPGSRRHLHPVGRAGSRAEKTQLSSCLLGIQMHHFCSLNGLEFEQTPGDGEGQGSLAVIQVLDMNEGLNNNSFCLPSFGDHQPTTLSYLESRGAEKWALGGATDSQQ